MERYWTRIIIIITHVDMLHPHKYRVFEEIKDEFCSPSNAVVEGVVVAGETECQWNPKDVVAHETKMAKLFAWMDKKLDFRPQYDEMAREYNAKLQPGQL